MIFNKNHMKERFQGSKTDMKQMSCYQKDSRFQDNLIWNLQSSLILTYFVQNWLKPKISKLDILKNT